MKLLIISHNPLTTYHNMGKTLLSLFSAFQKEELCQLYIYPSVPDVEACNSYFQITDKEVLRSYYKFSVKGKEVTPNLELHTEFQDNNEARLYRNPKNKTAFRVLARDAMWKFARWFNRGLKDWIEREKPTCIFVAPGDAKFVYDIAFKISKKYRLPIVSYVCDEYYFVKKPQGVLNKIRQRLLSKKIEKHYKHTSHIITICEELNKLYSKNFGVPATTVMTVSSQSVIENGGLPQAPQTMTYMGNIRLNRYQMLAEIGRALEQINVERESNYRLKIYSGEADEKIVSLLKETPSIQMCGFVSGEAYQKEFASSHVLIHTEAFDAESIECTKHSISTKIADSLGSGICLFAYGPASIASMRYLQNNQCAIVCTEPKDLKQTLEEVFFNATLRQEVCGNALKTAEMYHNPQRNGETIKQIFKNLEMSMHNESYQSE